MLRRVWSCRGVRAEARRGTCLQQGARYVKRFLGPVLRLLLVAWACAALAGGTRARAEGEDFEAGYSVGFQYLILTDRFLGPDGQLKPFADMTPREIGTVYHEMWHAWFDLAGPTEAPDFLRRFRTGAGICHTDVPREYRLEVHEEAAADYIEALISTYLQMSRFLAGKTPERREEIRKQGRYLEVYRRLFTEKYTGYYTDSIDVPTSATARLRDLAIGAPAHAGNGATTGTLATADGATSGGIVHSMHADAAKFLAPFIESARAAGLPTRYLTQAAERLKSVAILRSIGEGTGLQAEVHWSLWPLRGSDLIFIERDLLEARFSMDPAVVFSESRFTSSTAPVAGATKERVLP